MMLFGDSQQIICRSLNANASMIILCRKCHAQVLASFSCHGIKVEDVHDVTAEVAGKFKPRH